MLDNAVLKRGSVKKVLAHGAKRQAVAHLQKVFEVSRCRACVILGVGRTMLRYVSHRPDDASASVNWPASVVGSATGGCAACCARKWAMNHKKLRRLYREERPQVGRHGVRVRALGTRAPITFPQGPNQRWSLDFVSDAFACGRRFGIFAVVGDSSQVCVRLSANLSISGARVGRELIQQSSSGWHGPIRSPAIKALS